MMQQSQQVHSCIFTLVLFAVAACSENNPAGSVDQRLVNDYRNDGRQTGIALVVGTYTGKGSQGLYRITYDAGSGTFGPAELLAAVENPSYGAISDDKKRLYVVEENIDGGVRALHRQADDPEFTSAGSLSSGGAYPCYLALNRDNTRLAVANYGAGNIAVFALDDTGLPRPNPVLRQHSGHGPNSERQEAPHAHWVQWAPDGEFLYAVDLGADRVFGYPLDATDGSPGESFIALEAEPGAGPRHMVFHPDGELVYVVNELSNRILSARRQADGTLLPLQQLSTLPDDFQEHSQAGHIAINRTGSRVYVSNRGHDSLAVFATDQEGGLELLQIVSSGGHWPRFFLLLESEALVLVANERTDSISVLTLDEEGLLAATGAKLQISQPTYIGRLF